MRQATVIQISDPHLSETHGFFNANWRVLTAYLELESPDLVVASGDLTVNGADSPDDLAWAKSP